jgi:hypothetical protein
VTDALIPRGIRNNNPGNIRHGQDWRGMRAEQTDPAFVQFESPEYGLRALFRTLRTYFDHYNLRTARGIIERWAPPTENNTEAYVQAVAAAMRVAPNQPLDIPTHFPALMKAIIAHENGRQPYTDEQIARGIGMA